MKSRIEILVSLLPSVDSLADVGCDHGQLTLLALENKKCKRAIISDVSEKCLLKAQTLLKNYVDLGVVKPICTDGLKGIEKVDLVVIAGMGGEETVAILNNSNFLPTHLLLQPMKNPEKVRKTLLSLGYFIEKDFTFFIGEKYYDVIKATIGKDNLTLEELEFGKTNVREKPVDFIKKLNAEKELLKGVLQKSGVSESSMVEVLKRLEKIEKYV